MGPGYSTSKYRLRIEDSSDVEEESWLKKNIEDNVKKVLANIGLDFHRAKEKTSILL